MSLRARVLVVVGLAVLPALVFHLDVVRALWRASPLSEQLPPWTGLGLAGVLMLIFFWVGTDLTLLRDVRQLVAGVRARAAGRPTPDRMVARTGELGAIARAVDEMDQALTTLRGRVEQAEADRRAADARVLGVLAIATDAVIGVNPAQQITLFNKGAERIFGYAARDIVGQPLELVFPSMAGTASGRRPSLGELSAGLERREMPGRRKDDSPFTAEVSVSMRTQQGQASFMLVVRDLDEAKGVADALRASEARFRGAFEHSAAGMALQRSDGSFARVNRALCEMLGYAEQELLALPSQALRHPEDPEPESWYEQELLAGAIRWYQREQRYRHKAGHDVWGLLSVSLVRGGDGRPLDFLVQIYDITERKRAEALEAQLRQAQKIEAVGQLAAGVAHDFNNLLMVITGRSHILLHRLAADHPLRHQVELIQTTAERARTLTQQLLAFSRREALQPRVLDLNAVATGMAPMLRRLIGEQVQLVTALAPTLDRVKVDPGQIEQVVLNLVVNARDAMPQGGRVTITTHDAILDDAFVRTHPGTRPGPHVALSVADTGVGMDATTRARLFEPFFTTKGPGRGTGLGLAVVYGIVKQSGGYIGVESKVGQGSALTVYLPRAVEPVSPAAPTAVPLRELPGGSETILLVEDEEAVRDLTREILQQAGYAVLDARHGGHALLIGDRHAGPIHLLVTDVVMPELGGPQLAARLAATRDGLEVIFMSGYTDEALAPHGVLKPGCALLRKPLTPDALLRKVREVLDRP